jgi:hypothetical protein
MFKTDYYGYYDPDIYQEGLNYDPKRRYFDPNKTFYDPKKVHFDPNKTFYDPKKIHFDPNKIKNDQNMNFE